MAAPTSSLVSPQRPAGVRLQTQFVKASSASSALLISVVKRMDRPVSEVCHCFEPLPQILKNVRYKAGKPLEQQAVMSAIEAAKQLLGESGRLVIRPSGTEPVIRVMAEGDDRDLVERVVDDVVEAVTKAAA